MQIRPVSGCAIGKGMFASFAGYEETDILPISLVTECRQKLTKNCGINTCPRFRTGIMGSHKISWRKEGAKI
ncbi:MAG: hypothetical protein O8C66_00910 [Candidatus Methanoperedens sp.]|nr:hypothetical protein [Candidatus Methanoperedens sp.]MCZ7369051.1 hypothetical protein [Candidatus Methanoperedens sp.]